MDRQGTGSDPARSPKSLSGPGGDAQALGVLQVGPTHAAWKQHPLRSVQERWWAGPPGRPGAGPGLEPRRKTARGTRGDSLVPASCHPGPEVWKQHGGGDPFSHHMSEEARLSAPARPRSSTSAEARTQPNPKNAHGERTGLTGQRSPGAPALDGGTKPHQARTTPRHRQETEAGGRRRKSLSVQLQRYQRGRPGGGGPAAFFFFLFLN